MTTKSIILINECYSWKILSLWQYLNEGNIPESWKDFFIQNQNILYKISNEIQKTNSSKIYPPINRVFRAFIPINKIKVVILGQDPYHNKGSAVGYCFSVGSGNKINPSLKNIYKELKLEGFDIIEDGILNHWADQGCFLLNSSLTVQENSPDSHTKFWYSFTKNVVEFIVKNCKDVVWLLMGSKAQQFSNIINIKNAILSSHPSPFSAYKGTSVSPAFIGSNVFRNINSKLIKYNKLPIKW